MRKPLIITLLIAILLIPSTGFAKSNSSKTTLKKTNKKISLICEKSCSKSAFSRVWLKVNRALNKTEKTFKMPVPIKLPIEIRVGYDSACAKAYPEVVKANISKGFTFYKPEGGAMICINGSVKEMAAGIMPIAHELTHLYFNSTLEVEGNINFEERIVTAIAPCVSNCGAVRTGSICGGAEISPVFESFCKNYDLKYSDVPLFISRLAELRKNGQITPADIKNTLKYVSTH